MEVLVLQRKENDSSMYIVCLIVHYGNIPVSTPLKMYDQAVCIEVCHFALEKAVQVENVHAVRVVAMEVEF